MTIATATQRVIMDAALERNVIRGTLTAGNYARRDFHGWLELNTALEAILNSSAGVGPQQPPCATRADLDRGSRECEERL